MARSAWTSARGGARSLAGFLQVPKSETHRALVTREFVFRNKRWSQAISWTSLEFGVESSKAHCPWHGRAPRPPRLLLRGPLLRRHVFGSTPQCGGTGSKGTRSDADRWSPMPHPPAQDGETPDSRPTRQSQLPAPPPSGLVTPPAAGTSPAARPAGLPAPGSVPPHTPPRPPRTAPHCAAVASAGLSCPDVATPSLPQPEPPHTAQNARVNEKCSVTSGRITRPG